MNEVSSENHAAVLGILAAERADRPVLAPVARGATRRGLAPHAPALLRQPLAGLAFIRQKPTVVQKDRQEV